MPTMGLCHVYLGVVFLLRKKISLFFCFCLFFIARALRFNRSQRNTTHSLPVTQWLQYPAAGTWHFDAGPLMLWFLCFHFDSDWKTNSKLTFRVKELYIFLLIKIYINLAVTNGPDFIFFILHGSWNAMKITVMNKDERFQGIFLKEGDDGWQVESSTV